MRTNLNVPYVNKDTVRKLGAKWDAARKTWYVENLENLEPFMLWLPVHLRKQHEPHKSKYDPRQVYG